jgi:hypothetical protein
VVVVAGIVAAVGGAGTPVGAAGDVEVSVSPSTGLVDGQTIDWQVTGVSAGDAATVMQCDGAVAAGTDQAEMLRLCTGSATVPEPPQPATGQWTVQETFTSTEAINGETPTTVHCGDEPNDCVIAVWLQSVNQVVAVTAIDVVPSRYVVSRTELLGDGSPFTVWLGGDPGDQRTVAQCVTPPAADRGASRCGLDETVTLDGRGVATLSFPNQPTMTVGSDPVDCGVTACVLALFDGGGALLDFVAINGSPPFWTLAASPDSNLHDGSQVAVSIDTVPWSEGSRFLVGECLASATQDGNVQGKCRIAGGTEGPPPWHVDVRVFSTFTSFGGQAVRCVDDPGGCILAIGTTSGSATTPAGYVFVPITFGPPIGVTLSPASDLVDGQAMHLDATSLTPDTTYRVVHCWNTVIGISEACEPAASAPTVTASSTGTASATVTAVQRLDAPNDWWGSETYCRDKCQIGLVADTTGVLEAVSGYAMASGSISAAPAEGLHDGQTVTVTGSKLMTSYPGRNFWIFSTGTWAIGECEASVAGDPTIPGIFTHCTLPPPGGPVTVPTANSSTPFDVTTTLHPVTGTTVDCTTGPGACVVGLFRIEQDLSITLHTTPITFTTSP